MNKLTTPVAVIIAGLIIGGAVLYSSTATRNGSAGDSGGGNVVPEVQAKTPADLAGEIGLDVNKFMSCVNDETYDAAVQADLDEALAAGAQGTPFTVVVAQNGEKFTIPGAYPYTDVKTTIEKALAAKGDTVGAVEVDIPAVSDQDHILGNLNAPVKLIEYSDLQCPFCGRFHPTMQRVVKEYGDQVAWVYRHFPLESIHPNARPLANASECAANLGGNDSFWKFVDAVFGQM